MAGVHAEDHWYLKGGLDGPTARAALIGRTLTAARRRGKLLLMDTDGGDGPVLGLRFGMTGRLLVDHGGGPRRPGSTAATGTSRRGVASASTSSTAGTPHATTRVAWAA